MTDKELLKAILRDIKSLEKRTMRVKATILRMLSELA